jgi:tryptophan synthase alpha chain
MNRIDLKFSQLKAKGERALMPFITVGYPNLKFSRQLILKLERQGADMVELGIPFSDPIADGPTIQRSSQRSIEQGTTAKDVFNLVRQLREESQIPLILMTYYNLVYHFGEESFVKQAVSAGADGLIVPDLPPEEAANLSGFADKYGLDLIFLLAPTSTQERIELVSEASRGFIYYVSLTGITGARQTLAQGIEYKLKAIAKQSRKPVAVGFGISTPEQAATVAAWADGVIVGSAIINIIENHAGDDTSLLKKLGEFIRSLKEGIREVHAV